MTSGSNVLIYVDNIEGFYDLTQKKQAELLCYYSSEIADDALISASQVESYFLECQLPKYRRLSRFLSEKSDGNSKLINPKDIWFLKLEDGYLPTRYFIHHIKDEYINEETEFFTFEINPEDWKPSDIPFLNNTIRRNAMFFTKLYFLLYHVENSIRRFLTINLRRLHGEKWEILLLEKIDLNRPLAIRNATNLSELIPGRGDSILYYCLWENYADIIKVFPAVFKNKSEADEIIAHISSISKIRNGVAHNMETIPSHFLKEMEVFVSKLIRIKE